MHPLLRHDRARLRRLAALVGVDEAGRGAWAGPVAAGAVAVEPCFLAGRRPAWVRLINDSKQLSEETRERLACALRPALGRDGLYGATGFATVEEIAELNILGATRLAMRRALEQLAAQLPAHLALPLSGNPAQGDLFQPPGRPASAPVEILVDGRPLRPFPFRHEALVEGDGRSWVIAAASVLAKVARDHILRSFETVYPGYGFAQHKGYGTPAHREAICRLHPCPAHRLEFLPDNLEPPPPDLTGELPFD